MKRLVCAWSFLVTLLVGTWAPSSVAAIDPVVSDGIDRLKQHFIDNFVVEVAWAMGLLAVVWAINALARFLIKRWAGV